MRHFSQWTVAVALLGAGSLARAGDVGHFVGGMMDIRDYFVPEPGFYGALYNYFYTSDRYNDQNGNKVSSITIRPGPGPGTTLDVGRGPGHVCARPRFDLGVTLEGSGRKVRRLRGAHVRQCEHPKRRLQLTGPRRHHVRIDLRPGGPVRAAACGWAGRSRTGMSRPDTASTRRWANTAPRR